MMIEQNYNLDLVPSGTPLVVYVSQFDKGGRRLSFTLYKDNVAFTLPTGASATILGTKPDKIAFMYAMQTSGNKLYIDVTEQMTAVAGPVQCEIRVSNTAGEKIGSSNFIIYCEKTPLDSDAVISETDIPVFEELVAQANTAAAEANTASANAQQYAQQAKESAESIDVSALEAKIAQNTADIATNTANIATKAPSVSPTLKFAIKNSADGSTNPHAEFRTMGNSPSKSVGFAVYDENGAGNYYDLIKGDGSRHFAIVPELFYSAGDTFATNGAFQAIGMVTNGSKAIYITVTMPKLLTNINSVTVTRLIGAIRGISGYVGGSSDGSFNWMSNNTVTATKVSDNHIRIVINGTSAFSNVTNNTPVVLNGQVTFSFS